MQSLNEKLFLAVCKGKTGSVVKLLEQGANVNTRDKKDGMTPLLKACQRRNYTMQKILLSHGANPRQKDKLGLSCLHYIAEAGDTESLKMLMAYHASIDSKDVNDSTPLHYASDRSKLKAVDTLVFCGANAFEKNKNGVSPLKSAHDPDIEQILKESELVLTGIKNGDIHIESVELEPNKTYRLEKADLVIHTPSSFPLKSLSFICRRVRPEYCNPILKPYQKELLISDTFEFLTSETQTKAKVLMEVPIYDFPDPFEEIYMKTDRNPTIQENMKQDDVRRSRDEKTPSGRLKWICTTEVDVTSVRSFNLVAFPRKEKFHVGKSQTELSSSVDKFIKISIQENTFSNPKGQVCLEVIPTPVCKPDTVTSVMSVGHFYDLTHDKLEQPSKAVNLRVPLPHDYEAEGDIYLMGANVESDYYLQLEEDSPEDVKLWEVICVNPKITRGCVNIPVNHFSIYVASEAKRNKPKETILYETSQLCRAASQRRQYAVFLVLVKPISADVYQIIVECTTKRKKDDRMNDWINKHYLDQKPSQTGEIETAPGKKYLFKLSGNVKTVSGFPKLRLEFHPKKQENYQQFQVTMLDPTAFNAGSVDIYEIVDQPDGTEVEDGQSAVAFRLTGTPFVDDLEPKDDETFPGFTRDSLLRQLCKNMDDEDEWIKVAVLLGLSYRTVENCRTNKKMSAADKKLKVMQIWRDTSKHRVDYGVDDLVSALHRINREDLVQVVQKELAFWLKNHSETPDRFYKWTESKLTGPSFHSSYIEQPAPSSDQFFLLMIDKFGNSGNISQVGLHMGLSKPETDKIFNDALVTSRKHQMLGMFVAAREKIGDMFKTFVKLGTSLEALNMTDASEWVTDMTQQWLSSTEKDKNPVPWRQEIWHYLKKKLHVQESDIDNDSVIGNGDDHDEASVKDENQHEDSQEKILEQNKNKFSEKEVQDCAKPKRNDTDGKIDKKIANEYKAITHDETKTTAKNGSEISLRREEKQNAKIDTETTGVEEANNVQLKILNTTQKEDTTNNLNQTSNKVIVPQEEDDLPTYQQEEYASKLSREIVDEALESAIIICQTTKNDINPNEDTKDTNSKDIQELRHLLETNIETTALSLDPSVANSRERMTDSVEPDRAIEPSIGTSRERVTVSVEPDRTIDPSIASSRESMTDSVKSDRARDPSMASSRERVTDLVKSDRATDPSMAHSPERITDPALSHINEPKNRVNNQENGTNLLQNVVDDSSSEDSDDNETGDKERFLDVLNKQLPSAESSEDSSPE